MRENLKFIGKVMLIHIVTYVVCGMIFSTLFNYQELFELGNTKYFMRDVNSVSSLIGPLMQIVRGALFGVILLLFKDSFMGKKYGWLRLWAIIVTLGIINTPGPAPVSIEGLIYTQLPLELHLKGAPEILIQTLLFSYFVVRAQPKEKKSLVPPKYKTSLIVMLITAVGFSVSGMVLTLILGIDIMAGTKDAFAFLIMFIAMLITFIATQWYTQTKFKYSAILHMGICYIALAVLPTVYNFLAHSPFESYLSLVIGIIPTAIIGVVVAMRRKNAK